MELLAQRVLEEKHKTNKWADILKHRGIKERMIACGCARTCACIAKGIKATVSNWPDASAMILPMRTGRLSRRSVLSCISPACVSGAYVVRVVDVEDCWRGNESQRGNEACERARECVCDCARAWGTCSCARVCGTCLCAGAFKWFMWESGEGTKTKKRERTGFPKSV